MSLDHILLGLVREPCSGYDLKTVFDRSLSYFWPADQSQIYRTLKRLTTKRLLGVQIQASDKGPDRRVYSLTAAGRRQLRRWLASGPSFGDERFTYMAQLFFMAEQRDLNVTLRFVKQARDAFQERLQTFRRIDREWQADSATYPPIASDDGFHMHLTLRMGLHRAESAMKWCNETAQRIEERMASRSRGRRKRRRSE